MGSIIVLASICFSLSVLLWGLKLERRTAHAEANALLDPLTGLFNRRGWEALIAREWARSKRTGTSMTVIVMDLDEFKFVNDTYGHAHGDEVLKKVASAIHGVARVNDVVARLGGDEFALLALEDGNDFINALSSRLREALAAIGVAVSTGYATVAPGSDVAAAVELADGLMYADKLARRSERAASSHRHGAQATSAG
jgi:diguanylate cyclase (GGDEF)-like protein